MIANLYKSLQQAVRDSKLADDMEDTPLVCVLAGPAVVIECVIQKACEESGIKFDWGYIGGRAYIHGNIEPKDMAKAQQAIQFAIPQQL